jgi:hypothetical protein
MIIVTPTVLPRDEFQNSLLSIRTSLTIKKIKQNHSPNEYVEKISWDELSNSNFLRVRVKTSYQA